MIIQSLWQSGHERITLTFHDGNDFTTSLAVVTELRLFAGKELDEAQFETLKYKTSVSLARELGLELLSRRMHSRAAIVRHYLKKGYGEQRIRSELYRRGIPRDYWDEALKELSGTEEQIDRYLRSRLKDPTDREEVRKLSAALARRGFSWDEIRSAFDRIS